MPHSTATPAKIVAAARRDLHLPGPIDTCVINGMQRFAREAGAPMLTRHDGRPTASITEARQLAKEGRDGWSYHDGLDGIRPGDFADWRLPAGIFHVSTVIALRKGGGHLLALRTIGSGGPTGVINWQPAAGSTPGWNAVSYWQGYWRCPQAGPANLVAKPAPKHDGRAFVAARPGDGLRKIADRERISFDRIRELNRNVEPPEYGIRVGQQIRVR